MGEPGAVEGVDVDLPDSLSRYELPQPPQGAELRDAVDAATSLLDVAPPRMTVPLLAAVFRSVISEVDFSLF